ncbi:MAG: glycoside hydrolase family 3 C-terminal domain-containing protein [Proteobacteria bacterium]|nr:glycoside hydrolase family 3 C-terminal domain-containing protein [Pseudomonadota bacterium]
MKKVVKVIYMSLIQLVLCSVFMPYESVAGDDIAEYTVYKDPSRPVDVRVTDLLGRMTLKEKINQMSMPYGCNIIEAILSFIRPTAGYTNHRLEIPPLFSSGSSKGAISLTTPFPVSMARGASWDRELEFRVNEAIAKEAEAVGTNVVLGPSINIVRHPGGGRSQESYGEDAFHLGELVVPAINGLQTRVMSQVKHFALNNIETDRFNINVIVDERTLREVYLPHFKAAVEKAHVASIMSAYNRVNGQYMGENEHLLRDILKGEWGFDGFVASDWVYGTNSTVDSANNGLDIEMPNAVYYGKKLMDAVERGDVPMAVIDDSVSRILRKKFSFGLFDNDPPVRDPEIIKCPEHREIALDAARKGMVLLKNSNHALPLNRNEITKIGVFGVQASIASLGDLGSSFIYPTGSVTPLAGIKNHAGPVKVIRYAGTSSLLAKLYAKTCDAVVVIASLTPFDEGEWIDNKLELGGDRTDLGLSAPDQKIIHAVASVNDRVIVVVEAGSAVTMDGWIDNVEGVLMAWYPGIEGGNAIAEVLYGDANPSGKLPVTFPESPDQLFDIGSGLPEVAYGYYHGYRYFDKYDLDPLFPFGYGLSYTHFEYSNLVLSDSVISEEDTIELSFDIKNTGDRGGEEIAQLYIGYEGSAVDRAVRDLKGFDKIYLAPGETRTVTLDVAAKDLAYYDVDAMAWTTEKIIYQVFIGPSSREFPLVSSFSVN